MKDSSSVIQIPLLNQSSGLFTKSLCRLSLAASLACLLVACGGSGGDGGGGTFIGGGNTDAWNAGVYKDSERFENQCEKPRVGASKITGIPYPDRKGSLLLEKNWLRSWSHETYLWYNELPDINPANKDTAEEYFQRLVTPLLTANGSPKDKYHYADPTELSEARYIAGRTYGYGLGLVFYSTYPPRDLRVAYVESGSPAALAGIKRGAKILKVDGVDLVNDNTAAGVDTLNDGLSPADLGAVHTFEVKEINASSARSVTLQSAEITTVPVFMNKILETNTGKVGYIVFNSHIQTAEQQFYEVINNFKAQGINDLVLDLRYNGGGLIDLAAAVGYMIAGDKSVNKTFEQLVFNNKFQPERPIQFTSVGNFGVTKMLALPSLNLSRVFILSAAGTCSASESIINGLRGINVEVILIGEQTCGKPYGFIPTDNCGTT
ncbi:MAG TPA: S41 family peptidase, partial [Cellvibrio sp.]